MQNQNHSMLKEFWLLQKWNKLSLDPIQDLPSEWGQGSNKKFRFVCDCGKTAEIKFAYVPSGHSTSCGRCSSKPIAYWLQLRLGKLRLCPDQNLPDELGPNSGKVFWFLCDCGRKTQTSLNILSRNENNSASCKHCNDLPKGYWIKQKWGELRLDPNQLLPDEWSYGSGIRLTFICECGQRVDNYFYNMRLNPKSCGCVDPGKSQDSQAGEIYKKLLMFYPDTQFNTREVIKPFELDIWIPSIKTGIEYHGLHWHSEETLKSPRKDYEKYLLCQTLGIRLIQIYSDENWQLILDQLIPKKQKRIKPIFIFCILDEIKPFLSQYHYLGDNQCSGTHYICAMYKDKVVGAWVFKKRSEEVVEWTRACWDHSFKTWNPHQKALGLILQLNKYKTIVSFSDNRLHDGSLYRSLGFECVKELKPDYYYTKQQQRKHKFNFRVPAGVNEQEEAAKKGWYRIWDSGKRKWVKDLCYPKL
jgi:predicted SprT family Zn-dependent metalloprotease